MISTSKSVRASSWKKFDLQRELFGQMTIKEDQEILQDIDTDTSLLQGQMSDSNLMNTRKPDWTDESSDDTHQRPIPLKQCDKTIMVRRYRMDYSLHIHKIDKFIREHPSLPLSSEKKLKNRRNTTLYRLRLQQRAQQRDLFALVERLASEMRYSKICLQQTSSTEAKSEPSR